MEDFFLFCSCKFSIISIALQILDFNKNIQFEIFIIFAYLSTARIIKLFEGNIFMQISDNKVVSIHYTLTNDKGEVLDSSSGKAPLAYLHGNKNIISGLENALKGKEIGDKFNISIPPEEAYGVHDKALIQVIPKSAFQGIDDIEAGMQFQAKSDEGIQIVTITKVDGDKITVDGNHALAGETLTFDVEVTDVREATEEELQHGHVHGPEGHHH